MMVMSAPAKVNLHLAVGSLQSNGLHTLTSVLQTITLCDYLRVRAWPRQGRATGCFSLDLQCNLDDLPCDENNLVYRAASLWLEHTRLAVDLQIYLQKYIPQAAGLGGGSSDAAVSLQLLQAMFPEHALAEQELEALAFSLGSDVPFFLSKGTALVQGCGEEVQVLADLPKHYLLLVVPPLAVSTAEAFRALDEMRAQTVQTAQQENSFDPALWPLAVEDFSAYFFNDFSPLLNQRWGVLRDTLHSLAQSSPAFVSLSGSGPSCYAIYQDEHKRDSAREYLKVRLPQCRIYAVETLSRAEWQVSLEVCKEINDDESRTV